MPKRHGWQTRTFGGCVHFAWQAGEFKVTNQDTMGTTLT